LNVVDGGGGITAVVIAVVDGVGDFGNVKIEFDGCS
jgi:hypothetical protein